MSQDDFQGGAVAYEDDEDPHKNSAVVAAELVPQASPEDEEEETTGRKSKKRRDTLRKAPQAPKRFKSSYICFFMAKQPEIKETLGEKATISEISKKSAEMWKNLPAEERHYWDDIAAKDKERYMVEKASYTGPWQVPWKRAKKDPSAPKRPMSAFLYYSQGKRTQLKKQHPEMKNTEVSRLLGEMWRNASEEEKRPHIEKEKEERSKYKVKIAEWREKMEEKVRQQRQAQAEWSAEQQQQAQQQQQQPPPPPVQQQPPPHAAAFGAGDPYATAPPPHYMYHPQHAPPPHMSPYGHAYNYPYPGAPPPTKQPVILGPNGIPHYPPMGNSGSNSTSPSSAQQQQDFMPPVEGAGAAFAVASPDEEVAAPQPDYPDPVETLE